MKKSYTNEDLIRDNKVANYFYSLTKSKAPNKNSSVTEWIVYKLKIKSANMYLKYLDLKNYFIFYSTRYYPFSAKFKGNLYHNDFTIERKIIGHFELMGYSDKIYMSIRGFDFDKVFVYYVGFFNFRVDLEKEIEKLQKTIQKINPNFFVREYKDGWFKIIMPWNDYVKLREKYEYVGE